MPRAVQFPAVLRRLGNSRLLAHAKKYVGLDRFGGRGLLYFTNIQRWENALEWGQARRVVFLTAAFLDDTLQGYKFFQKLQ